MNGSVMNESAMNVVCYELPWTGMNVVCYERGLL